MTTTTEKKKDRKKDLESIEKKVAEKEKVLFNNTRVVYADDFVKKLGRDERLAIAIIAVDKFFPSSLLARVAVVITTLSTLLSPDIWRYGNLAGTYVVSYIVSNFVMATFRAVIAPRVEFYRFYVDNTDKTTTKERRHKIVESCDSDAYGVLSHIDSRPLKGNEYFRYDGIYFKAKRVLSAMREESKDFLSQNTT